MPKQKNFTKEFEKEAVRQKLAHYQNGGVAAARYAFGKGRAALIGPHPEATQDWYDDYGLHNPDGVNSKLIQGLLDAAMADKGMRSRGRLMLAFPQARPYWDVAINPYNGSRSTTDPRRPA